MMMKLKHTLLILSVTNTVGVTRNFCNWGPDGTAESSVCQGGAQGGTWCNENKYRCEIGCGGKWCKESDIGAGGGTCGGGNRGDGVCADGTCCSQWGWCGASSAHCGGGGDGPTEAPVTPTEAPVSSVNECPTGWSVASWTWYQSYAPCCTDSPNYDPTADTTECDLYNACSYTGGFAYIGQQTYDFVASNDLIAFFTSNGDNESYGNKYMLVSAQGKTVEVLVADTCGDNDCNGCCSNNAQPSGNLIDMEAQTVMRHFGSLNNANGPICWKLSDTPPPQPTGYCNWSGCDGEPQGGDWCNGSEQSCESGCNGSWCSF